MLAVRDQENLVHAQQTVTAGKPLNQGSKQLQPKTPLKVPLNDENGPLALGKKTIKCKQNENAKPAKDAFVTPSADPRQRAPLGMKTTNAKAKGNQTPAPGTFKPERTNKRGSTQKVKKIAPFVEQNDTEVAEKPAQDDVPDIEYMPPKPQELPDIPDDITYDTTFPQFQPKNLALGLESTYGDNEIGKDGLTKRERKYKEASIVHDKMVDDMILKQVESIGFEEADEKQPERAAMKETSKHRIEPRRVKVPTTKVKYSSNISTGRARDAASALSAPQISVQRARPTPRPRVSSSLVASRNSRPPTNPSPMRHNAAVATSKTTLGYSKGRDVSTKLHGKPSTPPKQPAAKTILSPENYVQLYGLPPFGSEMWLRCKAAGYFDDEPSQPEPEKLPTFDEDSEAENFQLSL